MAGEIIHHERHEQEQAGSRTRWYQHIPIPQRMQLRPPNDGEQGRGPYASS